MFPLILLVFGLGAALVAYETSPYVRTRLDDYARALRTAHDAHRAADDHLLRAHVAALSSQAPQKGAAPVVPVDAGPQVATYRGVDHAIAATLANQQAAQSTAEAAKIAQTSAERGAVADSAVRVVDRQRRIEEALTTLGVGQCGLRSYPHVTLQVRDALLAKLHAEGMTVTGDDPWDIDTQQAGVKLRAIWDPGTQVLRLIVTASSFLAPCGMIWERIDTALRGIIGA